MELFKKIYICHYTPLKDRKQHMIEQCKKYKILEKLDFIEEFDRDILQVNHLTLFNTQKLKLCEISLFLKHIRAMEKIVASGENAGIIMEDDVIFKDNFIDNFKHIMREIPPDFDILYTGFFPFIKEYQHHMKKSYPIPADAKTFGSFKDMKNVLVFPWSGNAKGTDFFIISKKCCLKFINFINMLKNKPDKKISIAIDWFMGQFLYYAKANVYWCDKEITIHGSWGEGWNKNAVFKNSMEGRGH